LDPQYLPKKENRSSDGSLHIYAHIHSDHARDLDTRRSVTTCAIFWNGTLLSWKSKMKPTVANSSMEAEYMALCFGACEVLGLDIAVTKLICEAETYLSL